MAGTNKIKQYAVDVLNELRADNTSAAENTLPSIDFGEVLTVNPQITIEPHHSDVVYEEDFLVFQIDPDELQVEDVVVIARDPSEQPVVMGIVDYENQDPFQNIEAELLLANFRTLESETQTWKSPVQTVADLPNNGNLEGDVRLVLDTCELYKWDAPNDMWELVSGGGGGGDFLPLTGGTLTGDVFMEPGTMIHLPDPPIDPEDVVNKQYIDDLLGAIALCPAVATITVSADYSPLSTDQVILVDATGGVVTITLPAVHIAGQIYEVKDRDGVASVFNITVVSADGDDIDTQPTFELDTNYQSVRVVSDGTDWAVI